MKKFNFKYLITDSEGDPMVWEHESEQLTFCVELSESGSDLYPVKLYSFRHAELLILKSIKYREKNNMPKRSYKIYPVKV